jgi:hypothetical protein
MQEESRMKLRNAVIALITLSLAVIAYAAPRSVYKVDRVEAKMEGNTVTIHAYGRVRTGGWTDGMLVPAKGTAKTLAYRFVATPPSGPHTDQITKIEAEKTTGPLLPPFPTKVKVSAETNSKTVTITH